jgi:glucose dehydrogenase
VYPWIWRHLPGPRPVRVTTAVLLVLAAAALLLFAVLPALDGLWEPRP